MKSKWIETTVAEIADAIQYGYTESSTIQNVGLKFLRITDIQNGKVDWQTVPYCRCDELDKYKLQKGDILFARTGATTGKSFLVKDCPETVFASYLIRVRLKREVLPNYVYQFFQTTSYWNQIKQFTTGSTQGGFNASKLSEIKIPLPSLPIQQQIAAILEKADAAREKRRQANQLTEQFLQSAFLEMFGDPATNPKGWEVVTIDDISTHVSSGSTPLGGQSTYLKEGIFFIRSQNVLMNQLDYSDIAHISAEVHNQMRRTWVKHGDVLLNITGASIGRVCYFNRADDTANVNQHVCIIRPSTDRTLSEFLSYFISMPSFQNVILARNSGATRQAFTFEQIRKFRINLPPLSEQQKFAALAEKVESLRAKQRQSERELEHLFHSLMQRAFRGELVRE